MSEILIITKKEFARFFSNKFTAFSALLLPGILMGVIYSAMGNMEGVGGPDEDTTFTIAVSDLPASVESVTNGSPVTFLEMSGDVPSKEVMREAIEAEKYDAYAVFPADFDDTVSRLIDCGKECAEPLPLIAIYYDYGSEKSYTAYETLSEIMNGYESSLANVFDINAGEEQYDLSSDDTVLVKLLSMILPMLILIMLVTSLSAISAESIAGEKERGTIATLLATPINRNSIVWGKLITVATIGVTSTIFTIVGVIVGLSNMSDRDINLSLYSAHDYLLLAGLLIPFTLLISVLMIILSALAPNIRSAQVYLVVIQLIVMGLALFVGLDASGSASLPYYLIPLYGTARALVDVFAFEATGLTVTITALVNIVLSVIGVFVAKKILNSERFMFQK